MSAEFLQRANSLAHPPTSGRAAPIVIVGGSGFIGSNLADSYLSDGQDVIVLDNLSRPGVEENLAWLKGRHGTRVHLVRADVRDPNAIEPAFADARAVFHLAAQTAVTTSLTNPVEDFEINARGTLHVLEAVRKAGRGAPVIFASTNKVYGDLADIALNELPDRHMPMNDDVCANGIAEGCGLDFRTPYGCSKGAAEQYVLDYAKSFGLPTAVLRMSCIYGPRQFGTEDQGWVAHFLLRALRGQTISIYGDGKQVRDVLHVRDAVDAYRKVLASIGCLSGRAFNLGGGPGNAVSLKGLLKEVENLIGRPVRCRYCPWRPGDQLFYVSDTRALARDADWRPAVDWKAGLRDLRDWIASNRLEAASLPQGHWPP